MRCSMCWLIDVCWIHRLRFDEVGLGGAYIVYRLVCVMNMRRKGWEGHDMGMCVYVWVCVY